MSLLKSFKHLISFISFVTMMLVFAIGIVSLTSPKYSNKLCKRSLKPILHKFGAYTSRPQSIAIGYLNYDEILDITVANSATYNIVIFLGYGNGTFANYRIYSTGFQSNPCSVIIGDFNNDNQSDIVVANVGTHNIGLFLGYGNGTFDDQLCFSTGSSKPISIAIGDLNRDSFMDIVVVGGGTNNIAVFLGNGKGYFRFSGYYWTDYGVILSYVTIADFNSDNSLDIAVANIGTGNVVILLGCNNGTLSYFKSYSMGSKSNTNAIAIGDFNNDNRLDLVIANTGYNEVFVMLGYGNGSFTSGESISSNLNSEPIFLAVGDCNNDKKIDIIISNKNKSNIGVLLGYGDGKFADQIEYSMDNQSKPMAIAAGDFNHDNQLDIAVVNYGLNTVSILMASITGLGGQRSTSIDSISNTISMTSGDLNNDTNVDIVVVNDNTSTISILLGRSDGKFTDFKTYSTGIDSNPKYVVIADFNHDDRLDIAVANSATDNVGVFLGYGNGTVTGMMTYSTGHRSNPISIVISDFNNDNHTDIAIANAGRYSIGILFGFGNGTFIIQTEYFMGYSIQPLSISVGDFNNDNRPDIIAFLSTINTINVYLGHGNGSFQEPLSHPTAYASMSILLALGDFNKDKILDVAAINPTSSNLYISLGYGNGSIGIPTKYWTGILSFPVHINVIDLNNDSVLDIIVSNYGHDSLRLFFGYGNGLFKSQKSMSLDLSHSISITINDFNKDGWFDIAIANDLTNHIVVLLGNYYVYFQDKLSYSTGSGSHPYFVVVADFDNDNQSDIAIANSFANNVGLLYGLGNGNFTVGEQYSTGVGSTPFALAVADFNNDNHLDIGFVNWYGCSIGLLLGYGNRRFGNMTTYSTGTGVIPVSMAVADLNHDARVDIIVSQSTSNSIGIFLAHDYTDFSSFKTYSTGYLTNPVAIVLGDFNNDDHLDIGVSNFYSHSIGIFLGYGNGNFANQMTYLMNIERYPTVIGLGDFNNDTHLDMAIVCHYPKSIGILLGHGNGTFTNTKRLDINVTDSDLGYLTVIDFNNDGRLDIAITNMGAKNIGVYLGHGNGTFEAQILHVTGEDTPPLAIASHDFNNDGFMDICVTILNNSNVGVLLGYGNGSFHEIKRYSMGTNTTGLNSIALGDLNGDQRVDIVVIDSKATKTGIFMGHGDGTFSLTSTYSTGNQSTVVSVTVRDLNNDERQDICILYRDTQHFGIFYGYGDGSFAKLKVYAVGNDSPNSALAVGDLNHDHQLDIVITSDSSDSVEVLLAESSKLFSDSVLISTGTESMPGAVIVEDFNHDQHMDIAVTNSGTSSIGILLGNGNGTFQSMVTYTIQGGLFPIHLAAGHLNHDYCLGITVANMYAGKISVFLGKCDGTFEEQIFYYTEERSISMSIALGDFNKDSYIDITIANYGSSTVSVMLGYGNGTFGKQTSYAIGYNSRPGSIAVGDFNRDNWIDIVVANVENENLAILLNLCEEL